MSVYTAGVDESMTDKEICVVLTEILLFVGRIVNCNSYCNLLMSRSFHFLIQTHDRTAMFLVTVVASCYQGKILFHPFKLYISSSYQLKLNKPLLGSCGRIQRVTLASDL